MSTTVDRHKTPPKIAKNGARLRDPSVASLPLAKIDATKYDLPASAVKLTRAEKKLLKDPDWITEDEADFINWLSAF